MKTFIFTCGDINGIGPEIIIKLLNKFHKELHKQFIIICPKNVFNFYCKTVKPEFAYETIKRPAKDTAGIFLLDIGDFEINLGEPTFASGKAAYTALTKAFDILKNDNESALVTAPISKYAISLAGINFPGHTEMLASWSGSDNFIMTFLSEEMNAALATIHIPVKEVSSALSIDMLCKKIKIIHNSFVNDFNIKYPSIAVLGLNPHSGEQGLIGNEEKKIIEPAIKLCAVYGASGPYIPDAFFGTGAYKKYDIVLGMYHDQVLIPFKMINFSKGVNFTAGLPIIRTSPDHGTAFDIAGKGIADESSIIEAFKYSNIILENRLNIGKIN